MSATPSPHRVVPSVLPLLVFICLLQTTAAALLSSHSSSDLTTDHLSSVTGRPPVTVSRPSRHVGPLQETPNSHRHDPRRPDPRAPRANLTLTLGGRLLLSRQAGSENNISGPLLSRDDPVEPSDHRGQAETPQIDSTPDDRETSSSVSGRHGRARSPLTTEHQSRRLPPEFLAFPVYWSNELSGRRAGGSGGGDGRKPALESPLADQIVTTTAEPRRRKTTPQPPPQPVTPSSPEEVSLPAPPAGCDAPGGPPTRMVARCRALRQLRRQTLQVRRQAAQQQAQQKLQRIIDLHLADVTDSVTLRARQAVPVELKRREPSSSRGTTLRHPGADQLSRGTLTQQPFTELAFEDATLLKARRVPQPIPTPRTATKTSPKPGKRRRQKTQRSRLASVAVSTTGRPDWVPVRVSAAAGSSVGERPGTGTSSGQRAGAVTGKTTHRGTAKSQAQSRGESRWRTYSSVSTNSIRTAPDKLDKHVVKLIHPPSTEPGGYRWSEAFCLSPLETC